MLIKFHRAWARPLNAAPEQSVVSIGTGGGAVICWQWTPVRTRPTTRRDDDDDDVLSVVIVIGTKTNPSAVGGGFMYFRKTWSKEVEFDIHLKSNLNQKIWWRFVFNEEDEVVSSDYK